MVDKIQVKVSLLDKEIAARNLENAITRIIKNRIESTPIEDRIRVLDRILEEINYDSN